MHVAIAHSCALRLRLGGILFCTNLANTALCPSFRNDLLTGSCRLCPFFAPRLPQNKRMHCIQELVPRPNSGPLLLAGVQ